MKSNLAIPSLYFSAYPLKAVEKINISQTNQSPYLKAILSAQVRAASEGRVRPITEAGSIRRSKPSTRPQLSNHIEPEGKDWFNHYE